MLPNQREQLAQVICSCSSLVQLFYSNLAASSFDLCAHIMAGVWDVQGNAGAAEPGAVILAENDETVLRVAFYNVGLKQSDLDAKNPQSAIERCERFAHDIAAAFMNHCLDLLCIC